jgi:subtilisin family serine protease
MIAVSRFLPAVALVLALAPASLPAAPPTPSAKALAPATYILRFSDAPLASYRGPAGDAEKQALGLEATSPAVTGAERLDLGSKAARAYRDYLADKRAGHLARIAAALGREIEVGFTYDVAHNGVSLVLDAAEAVTVATLPGIAAVEREWVDHLQTDAGPAWIGAERVWNGSSGAPTRGAGVVVGVIDSGINRTHPSFAAVGPVDGFRHSNPRGRFYGLCETQPALCNDKLIGIHDFSVCTGTHNQSGCDDREPNDGSDPDGHGSHVAATMAGNVVQASISLPTGSVARTLSGVAPHANVIAYKACEEEEACRGSWLLAAINQATADGVRVFNYSIGGDARDPWGSADALAMLAARDAGTVVVTSAGNSGPGPGTVSSPANAPWVIASANTTHDRVVVNRLVDLAGGATPPPGGGVLLGDGLTAGYGPADIVVPTDFPLCSRGTDLDSPPTGASNPWPAGRFSGQIVVCLRGITARVAKSNNVRLAGGGGMILVNPPADGESTVADQHSIPATHLGASAGGELLQWLSRGSGHRGRLEGAQVRNEPARADVLNTSSSRGPVAAGAYLKPDIAAPGTNVLAAAGSGNGFAFLTGTSMASPHIAGAATLLRALNPQWSVSDVESALRTSALEVVRINASRAASAFDQGAGRIDVSLARRAGLRFEVTGDQFRNARPSAGGNPRTLNLPSLVDHDCLEQCSFSRTVTDLVGGARWQVQVEAESGLQVQVAPSSFTLGAGAGQTLQITADVRASSLLGRHVEASIRLRAVDEAGAPRADIAPVHVPLIVYASPGTLPAAVEVSAAADRGFADLQLDGLVALEDIAFGTTALATPQVDEPDLPVDPTNSAIYDGAGGTFTRLLDVPAGSSPRRYRLTAIAEAPSSRDIDLFVGVDSDGDGLAEASEQLCSAAGPTASERCELDIAVGASSLRYWVHVQNFSAGNSGQDRVRLETRLVDLAPAGGNGPVVTGPARSARFAPIPYRISWSQLDMAPGERRVGYLRLFAGGGSTALAEVPLTLSRAVQGANAPLLLAAPASHRLRLAPGAASEHLAIDVPANATALVASVAGQGELELHLARVDTPAGPRIDAAPPRANAVLSARGGGSHSLRATSANGLRAGRWYVTPVNTGSAAAEFELRVQLETAGSLPAPRSGAYFNPARDGAGAFLFEADSNLGFLWYTYLQDGSPTWYIASAPRPAASDGLWRAELFRARWNGREAPLTAVGEVVLSKRDASSFQFGWNLDGQSGSERYVFIDGGGCARQNGAAFDINGFWFNPAQPGYGYSVNAFPALETNGAYFFDANGIGRWALGSVSPFGGSTLSFDLRRGACPLCEHAAPTLTSNIGTLVRSYSSAGAGSMRLDLTLPAPLAGRWQVDTAVQKLTAPTGCP